MIAKYLQRGEALDFVNAGEEKIAAGEVLELGDRVGVAGCDINPGDVGSVHMCGVFVMPKTDNAAIPMGVRVAWDGAGITVTAGSGTVPAGYAAAESPAGETTVQVSIGG